MLNSASSVISVVNLEHRRSALRWRRVIEICVLHFALLIFHLLPRAGREVKNAKCKVPLLSYGCATAVFLACDSLIPFPRAFTLPDL